VLPNGRAVFVCSGRRIAVDAVKPIKFDLVTPPTAWDLARTAIQCKDKRFGGHCLCNGGDQFGVRT